MFCCPNRRPNNEMSWCQQRPLWHLSHFFNTCSTYRLWGLGRENVRRNLLALLDWPCRSRDFNWRADKMQMQSLKKGCSGRCKCTEQSWSAHSCVDAQLVAKEADCDALFVFYGFNYVSIYTVWCFCLMVMWFGNADIFSYCNCILQIWMWEIKSKEW